MSHGSLPIVSVTVLTYNHENYIEECLDSIVCQKTNFPFEVIVADDASTDRTPDIVRTYAKKYPNLIVPILREKNIGVSANNTDVLKHCRGKYIAACDGDDSWCNPRKLQIQFNFLEKNPDFNGIFSWANTIDNHGNTVWHRNNFGFHIFQRHIYCMLDFQLGNLPGQFSSGMYRNIFTNPSYNWEELFGPSPVCDQIMAMMLCMDRKKIYVCHKRFSNYRFMFSNTVGTNYCSTMDTKEDLTLMHFHYYNSLEQKMKKLTGTYTNLRKRKYDIFRDALYEFKDKPSLSVFNKIRIMWKEEPHPFRMVIDGIFIRYYFRYRYFKPDKVTETKKA